MNSQLVYKKPVLFCIRTSSLIVVKRTFYLTQNKEYRMIKQLNVNHIDNFKNHQECPCQLLTVKEVVFISIPSLSCIINPCARYLSCGIDVANNSVRKPQLDVPRLKSSENYRLNSQIHNLENTLKKRVELHRLGRSLNMVDDVGAL